MPYYPPNSGGAPTNAEYVVGAADGTLSAERVVTDTTGNTGVTWDLATGGQAKANATNAGKWIKLATATASSSATIDFTGLTSSYVAYMVVLSQVAPATDATTLGMRTSTNNGSSYDSAASDYRYAGYRISDGGGTGSWNSAGAAQLQLTGSIGNASNEITSGEVILHLPSAAKYQQITANLTFTDENGQQMRAMSGGARVAAADVDAIRFLMASGNIASGQFDLYGLSA